MKSAPFRWAKASAPDARDLLGLRSGANAEALATAVRELDDSERRRVAGTSRGRASVILAAFDERQSSCQLAHMGDARAYLYRPAPMDRELPIPLAPRVCPEVVTGDGAGMVCLTWDHNTACDLVELEFLSRGEGRRRARRRVLTRGLGAEPPTEPDLLVVALSPGDRILLCTAGLWLALDDDVIAEVLAGEAEPQAVCRALTDAARDAGTPHPAAALLIDWTGTRPSLASATGIDEQAPQASLDAELGSPPQPAPAAVLGGTLGKLGRDLSAERRGAPPVIGGRKTELRSLIRCLMRMQKPNVVLLGEPGVGKTWLVEALARILATPGCPPKLAGCRVVEISMSSLVAGTRFRGDFEERMDSLIREAEADPSIILFIDEIHLLTGAGSGADGGLDAGNILKPALARGRLRVIGATTAAEFDRSLARDEALLRRFEVLRIEEPSRADALQILGAVGPELEAHHGLTIGADAREAAVDLGIRYLPDRRLPDKAIDLLDQACTRAVSRWLSMSLVPSMSGMAGQGVAGDGQAVTRDDVAAIISERCGLPLELVSLDDRQRLVSLPSLLGERVLGQEPATEAAARALQRGYRGLSAPERPVASMLLCGPTGVGKTSLALAIAELLFDSERAVLRIDMSEYMERHSVSRLLGAAPGYVGHEADGLLVAGMRARPARVVLFDEIEKAHPDVLNILLQILDAGCVRGSRGQQVSFRDAVVILTSNLLADAPASSRSIGFGGENSKSVAGAGGAAGAGGDDEAALREKLARALSPELVGRIGVVLRFELLSADALVSIAERHLAMLVERLLASGAMRAVPSELRDRVLSRISSERDSARGVERMVEDEVESWLAAHDSLAAAQPGSVLVDRLGGRSRASVALLVEVASDPSAAFERLRSAADLEYLSHAGVGAMAAFGGVHAAIAAARASTAARVIVHWGRVGRDGGAVRGAAVDRALSLARARGDGLECVLVTDAAREHLDDQDLAQLVDLGQVDLGLARVRVWSLPRSP